MMDIKWLRTTPAHGQLRSYVDGVFGHLNAQQKGIELARLSKQVLKNINNQDLDHELADPEDVDICACFTWADSPEGHNFWANIDTYKPAPKKVAKVKKVAEVKPKKPVGWW